MTDELNPVETEEESAVDGSRRTYSLKNLFLDPNNYRLINEPEYTEVAEEQAKDKQVERRTSRLLTGAKNQNIRDLVDSFKANGYLPVDQIQVKKLENGGFLVVEGNRRIAALKFLEKEYDEKAIDLGKLNPEIFSKVPVVIYQEGDELHHLTVMALKHISGNKKWGEWNQARLLEDMHTHHHLSENQICERIGISKVELRRSLRALSLVEQYQDSDYGDQFTETKFPLFREAVRNAALKDWLSWNENGYKAEQAEHRELFFSWLSREPVEADEEELGFADEYLEPALIKRDDVSLLGKMINDESAIAQLKISRDINIAYRSSNQILKERQEAAIRSVNQDIQSLSALQVSGENLTELESAYGRLKTIIDRTRASGLSGVAQLEVFHDRINQHFSSIHIRQYKRLQEFQLKAPSRINLFAGLNNSGKTTLLEAIYLLTRQNDFTGLLETVRRRGKVAEDHLNPEWFVSQLGDDIQIEGCFDDLQSEVAIKHFKETDTSIDKSRYLESVEISTSYGNHNQEALTRIYKGRDRETQAAGIKTLCPVVFSSPFFLNEPHRYATYYHKSTQSKALPKIFEFIQEKVLNTITDIRLVDEWQRFLVSDTRYDSAFDLTDYGEGLQRIFFISLLFASAQNGVVLIDEFENAIHADLIADFSGFIYELSVYFNVQVFLTSHSKECIDAFVNNIPDQSQLAVCALVENPDEQEDNIRIVAREFTGKKFSKLLKAGNVDLRRAH
ncbi:AAA family ATPase [Endozoicomonas numazuensis]|uniref:ATPase AAA-type core domain-containing protein n=1 Tax=Endozoicomonas numazuensis TaxID=1137799 RepID=A0A081N9I2_9GAMM|nr:AAA family ATPase [Endozoicomonas numazuensis]KEQ15105.1 hypothetical protein GZ78_24930 [Endozoicomonas numazuensis]